MPEWPELHSSARFINSRCKDLVFGGRVERSEVSAKNPTRNPEVLFAASSEDGFTISAESRGKEIKIFLQDVRVSTLRSHILFRFGMSGCFKLTSLLEVPKHAHLKFFATNKKLVLSFVDYRRFGRWQLEEDWGKDRGPDPVLDYEAFRNNILSNLDKTVFKRPICEAMLDQKYFNGIGNYLRAEILYRGHILPFDEAREVLQQLQDSKTLCKSEEHKPDVLELCSLVPKEVLNITTAKGPDVEHDPTGKAFNDWLQCYSKEGMRNLVDSKGRTIWFHGKNAGKMAPKNGKTRGKVDNVPKIAKIQVVAEEAKEESPKKKRRIPKVAKTEVLAVEAKEESPKKKRTSKRLPK